jgi:hypothetical protein
VGKRPTHCTYCGNQLDAEERRSPRLDEEKSVMCDGCYRDHYEDNCTRCGEIFDKTELSPKPGKLIGVWRDAPALGRGDLKAGYYRVLKWPIYADGMIEGYFFSDAIQRVGPLDAAGLHSAEEEQAMAGPMCSECQAEASRATQLALCFIGDSVATASTRSK